MPTNDTNPDERVTFEKTKELGIRRRTGPRATTYEVTISDGRHDDGRRKQVRRNFPTFKEAKDFKLRALHEMRDASYVNPSREKLGDFLTRWLDAQSSRVRPSTLVTYRQCTMRLSSLDGMPLRELTPARIHHVLKGLADAGAKPATVALTLRILRQALDDAVRKKLLKENPSRAVDAPYIPNERPAVMSSADVRTFRASIVGDPFRPLWELAIETGMRFGEMAALRWPDIDFETSTISVERTVSRNADGERVDGPPKTSTSRRLIAMSAELAAVLKSERAVFARNRLLDPTWNPRELLFPNGTGGYAHGTEWMRALRHACDKAGVGRINLHGLRHTSGTEQVEAGIPIKTVSERLGHTSVKTTLDLYVHPDRDAHHRAAEAMSARLRSPGDNDVIKTG